MFRRYIPRRILHGGLIFGFLFVCCPIFIFIAKHRSPPLFILENPYFLYDLDVHEPRHLGQKCVLPRLHPFHPSIWSFLSAPKPVICKSRRSDLTYVTETGTLKLNESEVEASGYEVGKSLHCYWSPILRGGANGEDDDVVVYGTEIALPKDGVLLPFGVEVVQVLCRNFARMSVYEKLHAHVRNATSLVDRSHPLKHPVNVLIFGLDSMSRLGFIRHLPLTYRYLTDTLKMTVLRGMNKVGDNTYPNLVALLTGHKAYGGGLPDDSNGFDAWPLIWKNFSNMGYATMWAEDFPEYGLFNYLAKGFRKPPTLHYLRPFWLAVQESSLMKLSSHMCYGSLPKHLIQMDYVRRFVTRYEHARIPYFGFTFLAELSHEYLSRVSSADRHFEEFFRFFQDEGYLKNTVLIVMSDHGHRFDPIRTTQVGHVEERMPFFAIRVPDSVSSLQPKVKETLSLNSGRLVTPFDVHATLSDIARMAADGQPVGQLDPPPGTLGQSLFKAVPLDRTCENASIPVHYCTCESETVISESDARAQVAADATIRRINTLLINGGPDVIKICVPLRLSIIRTAHLVRTVDDADEDSLLKVRVVIEAEPSRGIFESTVLVGKTIAEVLGDVSRINPYGGQCNDLRHAILRKYCYCFDSLRTSVTDIRAQNL